MSFWHYSCGYCYVNFIYGAFSAHSLQSGEGNLVARTKSSLNGHDRGSGFSPTFSAVSFSKPSTETFNNNYNHFTTTVTANATLHFLISYQKKTVLRRNRRLIIAKMFQISFPKTDLVRLY